MATILNNFQILFAYNSCIIEGNNIDYYNVREIFENGKVINFTGDLKTLYEITSQKDCAAYLLDKIISKESLSIEFIKKIHKLLTKGTYDEIRYNKNMERPGEYKKHDYVTGKNEVGSNVENVAGDMQDLVTDVNNISTNDSENVIKIATYFHNVLEEIYHFADCNGRLDRTLVNYILMTHDLPPIIIYNEDKKYHCAALEKFDEEQDLASMVEFFKYEIEKTWKVTLDNCHNVKKVTSKLENYLNN